MEKRLAQLFAKHVTRTITPAESGEFWKMVKEGSYDSLLSELIDNHQRSFEGGENPLTEESEARILDVVFHSDVEIPVVRLKRPWLGWTAAAVATIIVSAGILFYQGSRKDSAEQIAVVNDVAPGKQSATLTLANGKKIRLTDAVNGELAKEVGVIITKSADGQLVYEVLAQSDASDKINVLTTGNGETYKVLLPDGSTVWLNSASSLKYPASFATQKKRAVELQGEAYFQIAKDKLHPFVVKHDGQDVEVLGTHFNVSAYAGEQSLTTLEEGSVKVTIAGDSKLIVPGQQTVNDGNKLMVKDADLEKTLAWKDGNFVFSGDGIQEIMTKLQRWYDIEVVYDGEPTKEGFYANISRYKNISQVLKILEKTKAVNFEIKGRRVTVRN